MLLRNASIAAFFVLAAVAILLDGKTSYDLAEITHGLARVAALLVWSWVSGELLDAAHGVSFQQDRKLISDGNFAVAFSRSIGHAVLFGFGAMLILKI